MRRVEKTRGYRRDSFDVIDGPTIGYGGEKFVVTAVSVTRDDDGDIDWAFYGVLLTAKGERSKREPNQRRVFSYNHIDQGILAKVRAMAEEALSS